MDIRPDSFSSLQQAPENELSNETHMTIGQNTWRLFLKNHLATAGLFILVLITLFSLIGPLFSRFDYFTNNLNTLIYPLIGSILLVQMNWAGIYYPE